MSLVAPASGNDADNNPHLRDTFHCFPKLALEIRQMIWQHTLSSPRIIEATLRKSTSRSRVSATYLRQLGSTSDVVTDDDFYERNGLDSTRRSTVVLATLHVCRESREWALRSYHLIKHGECGRGSFYFNPKVDSLWFNANIHKPNTFGKDLRRGYGDQLKTFEKVMITQGDWIGDEGWTDEPVKTPSWYRQHLFALFPRLRSISILLPFHPKTIINLDEDPVLPTWNHLRTEGEILRGTHISLVPILHTMEKILANDPRRHLDSTDPRHVEYMIDKYRSHGDPLHPDRIKMKLNLHHTKRIKAHWAKYYPMKMGAIEIRCVDRNGTVY
jgi:hypothetical protein